jgi:predicted PurR-regulated permease PerM
MDMRLHKRRLKLPAAKDTRTSGDGDAAEQDLMPLWDAVQRFAVIGIFVIMLGAALMVTRDITAPVVAALIVGSILGPLVEQLARWKVPPFAGAILILLVLMAGLYGLGIAFSSQLATWAQRTPEISSTLQERFQALREPLGVLHRVEQMVNSLRGGEAGGISVDVRQGTMVETVVAAMTPAVTQLVLFLGSLLFFLAGRAQMRRKFIVGFMTREGRLLALRVVRNIERRLGAYLGTVSVINAAMGIITAALMWIADLPNPALWGMLAFILNYIPFLGPILMLIVLFGVSLLSFATLAHALVPVALYFALHILEGQIVTPSVVGRRLTLNPFLVFLALAFWTWIWGPIGAFMAVPLLVVGVVVVDQLMPRDDVALPG